MSVLTVDQPQRLSVLPLRLGISFRVLGAALVVYSLVFIYHAARLAFALGELNYAEGTWLFAALRVRYGFPIYFDYRDPPFIAMFYPPLDPWLAGALGALVGGGDTRTIAMARLLTLGATLLTAAAIYVCCRSLHVDRPAAFVAALLFFTPATTFSLWSFAARGDMLAVSLAVWAIACMLRRPGTWGLAAAGALAALALASKQTALAPLVAGIWWLLPRGRRRGLLPFAASFLGVAGMVALLTGPEGVALLARGTLDVANHPWRYEFLLSRLGELLGMFGIMLPVALVGVTRAETPTSGRVLLLRYCAIAALVLIISAGKVGSASSYCLELIAALCILAGLGLQWSREFGPLSRQVLLGVTLLVLAPVAVQTAQALLLAQQRYADTGPDDRPLRALADPSRGRVFSDNGYIVLAGPEPPAILDPYYFGTLAAGGRWDPEPLRRMAAERRFTALVFRLPLEDLIASQGFPQGVLKEMAANYQFSGRHGSYYVYSPKP